MLQVCLFLPLSLSGQLPEAPDTLPVLPLGEDLLQQRIESLAESTEEETDFISLTEDLEMLLNHPLNLNEATANDLHRLVFLNDIQIQNLIIHIRQNGKLLSILELQSIAGFDPQTIQAIEPFVTVSETPFRRHFSLEEILHQGQHQVFLRWQRQLEKPQGFYPSAQPEDKPNSSPHYPGSPFRVYTRYRFTCYNHLSLGFTAEKDPGEQFFRGGQPWGFDYYSGHAFIRDLGRLKTAVVGDYQLQFGQGLTIWSGLTFGKSSETLGIHKFGQGIRPHTSVDENAFFRGAAITVALGPLDLTTFVSSKRRDANVLETDTLMAEELVITSLQQTGLHRTPSELKDKHSVRENLFGGNLSWNSHSFKIGLTASLLTLDADFQRELSFYNQFDFNTNNNINLGCDYSFSRENLYFFGESALSANGGYALSHGGVLSLDPRLSISLLHRYFSRDYQSLYAVAFCENTRVVNEMGFYLGVSAHLSRRWRLTAYADHFAFPWMKYRTYSPTRGFEYLAQVNFFPSRKTEMYFRYRIRNKPLNTAEATEVIYPEEVIHQNFRFHISYAVSKNLTFRNRLEYVHHEQGRDQEQGFAIYQDVLYRNAGSPWALSLRYALFDTGGYDSRIYAYENDVLYAFSFPFYYHRGSRAWVLVRWRFNRHFDLYARLARTFYASPAPASSGPDAISENTRTEIKLQLRARF